MRTTHLLIVFLLALQVAAQRGRTTGDDRTSNGRMEDRTTLVNDSVRQVERFDLKADRLVSRSFYVGARPVGVWQEFDGKGGVVAERDFDKLRYGPLPDTRTDTTAKDTTTLSVVEVMPQFPGGEAELFKFLGRNVRYPQAAVDEGISGVVYLVGVVDEHGDWQNATLLRGVHPLIDYEAWRVTELMPDWTPGMQDGKPVKVQYNLPIRFSLR